jgi:hypothetical protein
MSILIKVICPQGIITATDSREVYSEFDKFSGKKVFISHSDGISKSYIKGKYLISICGNAYINSLQIKDIIPNFFNNLDDQITFTQLINEIFKLYKSSAINHSTYYYISFYEKSSPDSKYYEYFKIEPNLYMLDSKEQKVKRLNMDEDGFTLGIYWGGVSDKVETVLKEKRAKIDTNQFSVDSSINFIKETISDVLLIFEEQDEYPTIGGGIDLFIQTEKGIETQKI